VPQISQSTANIDQIKIQNGAQVKPSKPKTTQINLEKEMILVMEETCSQNLCHSKKKKRNAHAYNERRTDHPGTYNINW